MVDPYHYIYIYKLFKHIHIFNTHSSTYRIQISDITGLHLKSWPGFRLTGSICCGCRWRLADAEALRYLERDAATFEVQTFVYFRKFVWMIPGWCVVLALYPQNTQKCERASRRNLCYAPGFEGALCGQRKLEDTIVVSPPSSTNRNISTSESQGLDIGWGDAVISISVWHGQYSNCIQVQLLVITAYLLQLVTLWSAHPGIHRWAGDAALRRPAEQQSWCNAGTSCPTLSQLGSEARKACII